MKEHVEENYLSYLEEFKKFVKDFEKITEVVIEIPDIMQHVDFETKEITKKDLLIIQSLIPTIEEIIYILNNLSHDPAINFTGIIKNEFSISNINLYSNRSKNFITETTELLTNFDQNNSSELTFTSNLKALYRQYFEQLESIKNKVSLLKIMSNLTNVTKNSVLIGPNGSGKSSFARQIKNINSKNLVVISAQKFLFFDESRRKALNHNAVKEFRESNKSNIFPQMIGNSHNSQTNHQLKQYFTSEYSELLNALESEHLGKAHEQMINNEGKSESVLEKVIKIWEMVIPHRELLIDTFPIVAYDPVEENEYNFNLLSDGEKAVFYYIAMVLLAGEKDYIIVDEPENHLNLSVLISLWNQLEIEKPNCLFIYITHNIQFATSRRDFNIIWNKFFTAPDEWEIELIEPDNEIPDELIIELLGTQKDIIFCEGEKGKEDYNFLQALFGDTHTIIPASGHLNVVNITKAYNSSNLFKSEAIAIIDKDYYDKKQLEKWKESNIYSLPFLEIENIYVCDEILDCLSNQEVYDSDSFKEYKKAVINKVEERKEELAIKFVKQRINNELRSNYMSKTEEIEILEWEIEKLFSELSIKELYAQRLKEIEQVIENHDYKEIITNADLKGILTKELTNRVLKIPNYPDIVINLLNTNTQINDETKEKYFSFVNL